jgi:hypothetical protein
VIALRLIAKWLFVIGLFHGLGMLLAADFMREFTSFMFDPYIDLWRVHRDTFSGAFSISGLLATYQALPDAGRIIFWLLVASMTFYGFMNAIKLSQSSRPSSSLCWPSSSSCGAVTCAGLRGRKPP